MIPQDWRKPQRRLGEPLEISAVSNQLPVWWTLYLTVVWKASGRAELVRTKVLKLKEWR
jgi:hypothetical protein